MTDGHEKTILSFMMRGEPCPNLEPDDFSSPTNRMIFEAIRAVSNPDLLPVQGELKRRGQYEPVGGKSGLTEVYSLGGDCIGPSSLQYAVDEVLAASRARRESEIGKALLENRISGKEAVARLRDSEPPSEFAVRTAAEVLAMPVAENSCLLGAWLLALGQALVIAGVGGIGKTRLLLQFSSPSLSDAIGAASQRTGAGHAAFFCKPKTTFPGYRTT
ncbi:MAG: hypothetical protein H0X34_01125 [Chthoniobacterales bacterium]|nr:hypothetical protein [Chthoniobacterales bacterium]